MPKSGKGCRIRHNISHHPARALKTKIRSALAI
jgi:hypothetical protein